MIAYFDTSAVVPLIIHEQSTARCTRLWDDASRIVSIRLLYPEARAALAKAQRMARITQTQLIAAVRELDSIVAEIDHVELTAELASTAGRLAQDRGLRGYDAVHLASALAVADEDLVLVTGDATLAAAGSAEGLAVAVTV